MSVRLVLVDRDGTINRKPPDGAYVTCADALELLPGAAAAIRMLNDAGIPVAVVTNQRGVARGELDEPRLATIHAALRARLAATAGAHVDAIYHCPHEPGTCTCRKPEPGLLAAAAARFGVPPAATVMIGDTDSDIEAGRRFGARTIRLAPEGGSAPDTADDLQAAIRMVVGP
jgi:D-glycero-D-manno-heptose 1,7-bisphosphate phosphatase